MESIPSRSKIKDEQRKKIGVAIILTIQVTAMVLTLRYSKTTTKYVSSTAVLLAEFGKLFICVAVLTYQYGSGVGQHLYDEILAKPKDMILISPPALAYLIQNNLLFFAMEHLEAAIYQVTYQLKILTTAICMVFLLGKRLSGQQWLSLVLLSIGVAMAQFQPQDAKATRHESQWMGLFALIIACFTSGFAGVYTEKLLKQTNASLWVRNSQLAMWSIVVGLLGVYTQDYKQITEGGGFFQGYNVSVWCVVMLQSASGIVVAVVIKVADNIVKNFSVAMSLLLATLISMWLFGFQPNHYFVMGACLVLLSVHLYTGGSVPGFNGGRGRPPGSPVGGPRGERVEVVAAEVASRSA